MYMAVWTASIAGETPTIKLGNGQPYREGSLWKDIYQAILNAKHFVYIAGEPLSTLSSIAVSQCSSYCWLLVHPVDKHWIALDTRAAWEACLLWCCLLQGGASGCTTFWCAKRMRR